MNRGKEQKRHSLHGGGWDKRTVFAVLRASSPCPLESPVLDSTQAVSSSIAQSNMSFTIEPFQLSYT